MLRAICKKPCKPLDNPHQNYKTALLNCLIKREFNVGNLSTPDKEVLTDGETSLRRIYHILFALSQDHQHRSAADFESRHSGFAPLQMCTPPIPTLSIFNYIDLSPKRFVKSGEFCRNITQFSKTSGFCSQIVNHSAISCLAARFSGATRTFLEII